MGYSGLHFVQLVPHGHMVLANQQALSEYVNSISLVLPYRKCKQQFFSIFLFTSFLLLKRTVKVAC